MQRLSGIDKIQNTIGCESLGAVFEGRQISGGVEETAIGLADYHGRWLALFVRQII